MAVQMPVRSSARLAAKPRVSYAEEDEPVQQQQQQQQQNTRRSPRIAAKSS
jgi:hypothetical protein